MSPSLLKKWQEIREFIPSITEDRIFHADIEKLNVYLKEETEKK
ncbi:histidine ammonia-lyase [Psychrobacillus sp. OK032]|nr:histidine ammonia-lyase [Psychrobacillus sp. OK032]